MTSPSSGQVARPLRLPPISPDREARVVLEEVSRRLPTLTLAANANLEFPASISLRGPRSLPVTWY